MGLLISLIIFLAILFVIGGILKVSFTILKYIALIAIIVYVIRYLSALF